MTVSEAWTEREKLLPQLMPAEDAYWYRLRIDCVPCWHLLPLVMDEWPRRTWLWRDITARILYERVKEQWAEAGEVLK